MPAVKKVSGEKIIDAAVEVLREGGAAALNARSVAKQLGCSTQPIYLSFRSMDELKDAMTQRAIELNTRHVREWLNILDADGSCYREHSHYSSFGIGFVKFAAEEKHLFRWLYLDGKQPGPRQDDVLLPEIVGAIVDEYGYPAELAQRLHRDMAYYSYGLAILANTGHLNLTDAELLAILLRTGTAQKSALEIAKELTADGGLYRRLAGVRDLNELMQIKGMGQAKAATVLAALEIGRRIASARPLDKIHFGCPQDGAAFLMPRLRYATKEQFLVILLNSKNKVIGTELVSEGSLTNSVVHPREVFLPAILQHAASICVAHNHPSGDPTPSIEDKQLTAVLLAAGRTLGIPLLDHLIIGDGAYYSFQEDEALEV